MACAHIHICTSGAGWAAASAHAYTTRDACAVYTTCHTPAHTLCRHCASVVVVEQLTTGAPPLQGGPQLKTQEGSGTQDNLLCMPSACAAFQANCNHTCVRACYMWGDNRSGRHVASLSIHTTTSSKAQWGCACNLNTTPQCGSNHWQTCLQKALCKVD